MSKVIKVVINEEELEKLYFHQTDEIIEEIKKEFWLNGFQSSIEDFEDSTILSLRFHNDCSFRIKHSIILNGYEHEPQLLDLFECTYTPPELIKDKSKFVKTSKQKKTDCIIKLIDFMQICLDEPSVYKNRKNVKRMYETMNHCNKSMSDGISRLSDMVKELKEEVKKLKEEYCETKPKAIETIFIPATHVTGST